MKLAQRARATARDHLLTAADTWERHLIVANLLGAPRQVLDVGGLPGQLNRFIPGATVLAANVAPPADLLVDPGGLPFMDRSMEAVTSLDALEHVPPTNRANFVAELVRVAAHRVVLCCPLGTPGHVAAEREVERWYEDLVGEPHPWLIEHRELGLPTAEQLAVYAAAAATEQPVARWRLAYHGDFRVTDEQFRQIVLARHRPRPRTIATFVGRRVRHRPELLLADEPQEHTNRVFLIVERGGAAAR